MRRVALAALLLAVVGMAACGDDTREAQDILADLQRAIDTRDQAAYEAVIAVVRGRRPLAAITLQGLAAALLRERRDSLAWPGPYCPSSLAILHGASDAMPWLLKGFNLPAPGEVMGPKWLDPPEAPPYVPADDRLIAAIRQRLRSDDDGEVIMATWTAVLLKRDERLALAESLIRAMKHQSRDVSVNCKVALADVGAPVVPLLASALRGSTDWHARELAWTLSMMGAAATGARDELRAVLADKNWGTRMYAAVSLLNADRSHRQARETLLRDLVENDGAFERSAVGFAIRERLALVEVLPRLKEMALNEGLDESTVAIITETIEGLERVTNGNDDR